MRHHGLGSMNSSEPNKDNSFRRYLLRLNVLRQICFRFASCLLPALVLVYFRSSFWFASGGTSDLLLVVLPVCFRRCFWFASGRASDLLLVVLLVFFRWCFWFASGHASGLLPVVLPVCFWWCLL